MRELRWSCELYTRAYCRRGDGYTVTLNRGVITVPELNLGIGPLVRRAFGRHEPRIAAAYRGMFVDLDAFVASIRTHVPAPVRVLEIGCGEGAVTERLAAAFPGSVLTGIDVCAQPGRLYRGDRSHVRFLRTGAAELRASESTSYHLVIIADVLHHVPYAEWRQFLSTALTLLAESGTLILKDWVRKRTPAYLLGYLSDRLVTGDRIRYPGESELRLLAESAFGRDAIRSEFRVPPWNSNLALVISPQANRALNCETPD
jgi:SAM-dependent methyltransferase